MGSITTNIEISTLGLAVMQFSSYCMMETKRQEVDRKVELLFTRKSFSFSTAQPGNIEQAVFSNSCETSGQGGMAM